MASDTVKRHLCEGTLPDGDYGEAITYCSGSEDGGLYVGNGEYASDVAYCPYCGYEAKKKPIIEEYKTNG